MARVKNNLKDLISILNREALLHFDFSVQVRDPLVDRLSVPDFEWCYNRLTQVNEALGHELVGMISMSVTDKQHITLANDLFSEMI
jgi:hypothetical protein